MIASVIGFMLLSSDAISFEDGGVAVKHFCDAQNRDLPKSNQINFISVMIASVIGFMLLSSDAISFEDGGVAVSGLANGYLGSKGLLTAFIAAYATGIIYKFFVSRNITIKMPEQVPPNISQTFKDIIPFAACLTLFWGIDATGIIYKFFVSRNITIKMPEQVPPNISQTFKDIIPFAACLTLFWGIDFGFRSVFGFCFAQGVIQVFQPLFSAADGYLGLAIIYGAMSLFWFVGVHGPSIVEPAISAALISNLEINMAMYQAGEHATAVLTKPLQDFVVAGVHGPSIVEPAISAALISNLEINMAMYQAGEHATAVLTKPLQDFVVAMGGTGATLVICFMFAFLAKSKEMRAVGRASAVPVCFGVNEPFLFGAPMVLNPIFFIPFILAPIANIWITKFFIDVLGMNGFMFSLPWTTPAPVGIAMGLGLQPLAFLLIPILLVCFGVNEPFLFGAPMVLNPIFFIPFIFAPIANIWITKFFIDVLGMNGFMFSLPWTTPAPVGIAMGLGLQPLAFLLIPILLIADFVICYPFFKVYDRQKCAEEAEIDRDELAAIAAQKEAAMNAAFQGQADTASVATGAVAAAAADMAAEKKLREGKADTAEGGRGADEASAYAALNGRRVLVLCQGGGTSGLLANALGRAEGKADTAEGGRGADEASAYAALNGRRVLVLCQGGGTSGLLANALGRAAREHGIDLETAADAYGNHIDIMPDFDLVILAPQAATYFDDLKADGERAREHGIDLETAADAYGNHIDIMPDFDLVILAPQAATYFDDLKADGERMGVACCVTRGKQYIDLTRDGEAALAFVAEQLGL